MRKKRKKKKCNAFHMKIKKYETTSACNIMCVKMPSNYTMKTLEVFYESHNATMQGYVKWGGTPIRVKLKP
jgi:hypothetical protein